MAVRHLGWDRIRVRDTELVGIGRAHPGAKGLRANGRRTVPTHKFHRTTLCEKQTEQESFSAAGVMLGITVTKRYTLPAWLCKRPVTHIGHKAEKFLEDRVSHHTPLFFLV